MVLGKLRDNTRNRAADQIKTKNKMHSQKQEDWQSSKCGNIKGKLEKHL